MVTVNAVTAEHKKIKFEDVVKHLRDYRSSYEAIGGQLVTEMKKYTNNHEDGENGGRKDEDPEERINANIYAVKYRIKTPKSAYLKTKRKKDYKTVGDIKDFCGVRVLCLFERDIFNVNEVLLKYFARLNYHLEELKIFNFEPDAETKIEKAYLPLKEKLKNAAATKPGKPKTKIEKERKGSGYKSVHYTVITGEKRYFEVQLRTLLQDVWGELEHSLSYKKGSINPHIKKSFELLSKDLANVDDLMEHLKAISIKEETFDAESKKKSRPKHYFEYDDGLVPDQISGENTELLASYKEAIAGVSTIKENQSDQYKAKVQVAKTLREQIANRFHERDLKENCDLRYWLKMEEAYLLYCETKLAEAEKVYTQLKEDTVLADRYCLRFRLGEIYAISNRTDEALREFDECERILGDLPQAKRDIKNQYEIKVALALVYWMLGDEYINVALEKIHDAELIYEETGDSRVKNDKTYARLQNNLVWYHLSRYIIPDGTEQKKIDTARTAHWRTLQDRFIPFGKLLDADGKLKEKLEKLEQGQYRLQEIERIDGKLPAAVAREKKALEAEVRMLTEANLNVDDLLPSSSIDTAAWYFYHQYQKSNSDEDKRLAKEYCNEMVERKGYTTLNSSSNHVQLNHRKEILAAE